MLVISGLPSRYLRPLFFFALHVHAEEGHGLQVDLPLSRLLETGGRKFRPLLTKT